MPGNIHVIERIIRYLVGVVLLTLALAGGPFWTYGGFILLLTASFGSCPVYWVLRINSRS